MFSALAFLILSAQLQLYDTVAGQVSLLGTNAPIEEDADVFDPWKPIILVARNLTTIVQPVQSSKRVCTDVKPQDAPFGCIRYAKLGLCNGVEDKFCQKSCERCSCDEAHALFCDVQGLMAFKDSFWKGKENLESWQGDNPCHGWEFITCDPKTKRVGMLEMRLLYTVIENTMSGSLVPELSKLRYLQVFSVYSVYFSGELPPEYSLLNNLKSFSLILTGGVNGTLPPQYKEWSQIEVVYIFSSQITGTIPVEFSLWKSLNFLVLNENSLHGKIPPNFSTWKQLTGISLISNKITGSLSKEFSEWQYVTDFRVPQNNLTGSLPKEFSTLSRMRQFWVNSNHLRGNLPAEYRKWEVCELFSVMWNFFTGTLPVEYSKMKRMKGFYIRTNNFRGRVPKEYSTMTRLENFTAFDNNLNTHIPKEWSKLQEHAAIRIENPVGQTTMQQIHFTPQVHVSP